LFEVTSAELLSASEVSLVPGQGPEKDCNSVDHQTEDLNDGDEEESADVADEAVAQRDGTEDPSHEEDDATGSKHDSSNLSEHGGDLVNLVIDWTSSDVEIV